MRAWVFQDVKQRDKHGPKRCPWSVGWYDVNGRKRQKSVGTKTAANALAKKLEGQEAAGLLRPQQRTVWAEFVERFDRDHLSTLAVRSQGEYRQSLKQFETICGPRYVQQVDAGIVDRFRAKRLAGGATPATVNKDLRHLRVALNKARKWKLLPERIEIEMLREPQRDPEFIDDATFAKLYQACGDMTRPAGQSYPPSDWWRALLTFAYLTGWRVSEIMSLRRDQLDFESGVAMVGADQTKGKRDARVELHSVVLEHLSIISGTDVSVFPWPHYERALWVDFAKLKKAAGVDFSGAFHRFRFGFANANVDHLPADVLQHLMRHQAAATTRIYIDTTARMKRQGTADRLHVPAVLRTKAE